MRVVTPLPESVVASVPKMVLEPSQVLHVRPLANLPPSQSLSLSLRSHSPSMALSSLEPALGLFEGFGSCICCRHITEGPTLRSYVSSLARAIPGGCRTETRPFPTAVCMARISHVSSCFWSAAASSAAFFSLSVLPGLSVGAPHRGVESICQP